MEYICNFWIHLGGVNKDLYFQGKKAYEILKFLKIALGGGGSYFKPGLVPGISLYL